MTILLALCSLFVFTSKMLGILVGILLEGQLCSLAVTRSRLLLLVTLHLALCSPSLVGRPMVLCIMGSYGPEGQLQWHVQGWYFW